MPEFTIPMPANEAFRKKRNHTVNGTLASSARIIFPLEKIELTKEHGYLIYKKGLLFPTKGLVYPEAVKAINVAKKGFMTILWTLKSPLTFPTTFLFLCSSFKKKVQIIQEMLQRHWTVTSHVLEEHLLEHENQVPVAKELEKFVTVFLKVLGIEDETAERTAATIAAIFEYDDAYRYRLQDILSETTKDKLLEDPVKEMTRLAQIYAEREESERMAQDFKTLVLLSHIIKRHKRLNFAFQCALGAVNFKGLQYDEIDYYNVLYKGGFNFLGRTFESRYQEFLNKHNGIQPEYYTIDQ